MERNRKVPIDVTRSVGARTQAQSDDDGGSEVDRRASGGDQHQVATWIAKETCIHRHGPPPAEMHEDEQDRANCIEMGQRVEGYPPKGSWGWVTQSVGHHGMGKLVKRQCNDDRGKP